MTEQQNVTIHANTNTTRKKLLFFFFWLIIVVFIAISCYFGCNFIMNKLEVTAAKAEETYAATKQLQIKYEQLQNNLQDLQKELQKSNIAKTRYWKPIVIEHLVHLADLTLNTTRDTKLALAFLSEARQYASDSALSAINHALNKDIANLQAVPAIDVSDLVLKIEAISQKVGSLPIIVPQLVYPETKEVVAEGSRIKTLWQRFFNSTIKALKDIVVIRHKSADLLLSPDQEAVLRLEIQAKLLQAELAVMQRKNKIYQTGLEETANLFKHYFVANQSVAIDVLPLLQELQQVNLEPAIPFPSESIAAITNFVNASKFFDETRAAVAPAPPSPVVSQQERM